LEYGQASVDFLEQTFHQQVRSLQSSVDWAGAPEDWRQTWNGADRHRSLGMTALDVVNAELRVISSVQLWRTNLMIQLQRTY
jgi:hypothetical protein